MLGIGFHSFIDGFIYSITVAVSVFTGLLTATGMALDAFPEGMIPCLLLALAGFSEKSSFLPAFLTAAITTPAGIVVSYPSIASPRRFSVRF